ncbi:MAG: biotin synthase BioB [Betaproteobacteria bacterium]|nr:MAG: biotin synthase BioB [Betaproteobacteria bacterium]
MNADVIKTGATAAEQSLLENAGREWAPEAVMALFDKSFGDLVFEAQRVHRTHFKPNSVQLSTLLSVKTGGCPEDCGYCPQAARYHTGVENQALMSVEEVLKAARAAKENGATRFCMGAAWRGPKQRDVEKVAELVTAVKSLGLETCATLGMLKEGQAEQLKAAGLDYYNHNIDTGAEHYQRIVSTRTQDDRYETLTRVRDAGLNVCCGGIVGMGESRQTRAELISRLASMDPYPESVPINNLVQVKGTPLYGIDPIDPFEFVRTIACARLTMPRAMVRLSAGREQMSDELQALCFMAGANSIFYGDKLLTTGNPQAESDRRLFSRLGLETSTCDAMAAE